MAVSTKRLGDSRLLCFVILFGLRKQEMADLCDYAIFRTKMTQFKRKHYVSSELKGQVCKQIPSMEMMISTSQKERRTWHVTSWIICLNCPFLNVCLQFRRPGFDPWAGKGPWRTEWQPTLLFLPGEFHGQRNLASYHPQGRKESDTTEWLTHVCPSWIICPNCPFLNLCPKNSHEDQIYILCLVLLLWF